MKLPYQIRIEAELLDKIRKIATENGTSVNHQFRLAVREMIAQKQKK